MTAPVGLKHLDSPIGENHIIHNFVYANAAARLAAVLAPTDTGKVSIQSDDGSIRALLTSVGPIWSAALGPGFVTTGENAAAAGAVRMPSLGVIAAKAVGAGDVHIASTDASDNVLLGHSSARVNLNSIGLGIGAVPTEQLHAEATDTDLKWVASSAVLQNTRYSDVTSPVYNMRRALGTRAAPAEVTAGSLLGQIGFVGYHSGGAFGVAMAAVRAHAAETFTSTAQGTNLRFLYAPTGTVTLTEGARLSESGNFGVGGTPASTCRLDVLGVVAGAELCSRVFHSDNTNAASHARQWLVTGGASGGDPNIAFTVTGVTDWSMGVDNSDSDKLIISRSLTVGVNPAIVIDTANFVGIATTTPLAQFQVTSTTLTVLRYTTSAAGIITDLRISTATGATSNYHRMQWNLRSDAAVSRNGVNMDARLSTITDGAEVGEWSVRTMEAGAGPANMLMIRGNRIGFFGIGPVVRPAAYTRNATVVESRTLLASASATVTNCNNVLAALIGDLQGLGLVA